MRRLQRRYALIFLMTLVALLLHAENTSKRHLIALRCPQSQVHCRVFDQDGKQISDFSWNLNTSNDLIDVRDPLQSIEASRRYVVTSSSRGCIQGQSDFDEKTGAPVNRFNMPCGNERPIDLRITSEPAARFVVRWEIPTQSGRTCHWEMTLKSGSLIEYYTSDEKLIIDATAINDPNITGHLELDWDHVPLTKTTISNPGRAKWSGPDIDKRQLKTFTIEPLPR